MSLLRRARGVVLRLVRRRLATLLIGLSLIVPAAWIQMRGGSDAWWTEGLSLVSGAAGLALVWTGLFGLKPDWQD